jgi:hypothetical protein
MTGRRKRDFVVPNVSSTPQRLRAIQSPLSWVTVGTCYRKQTKARIQIYLDYVDKQCN